MPGMKGIYRINPALLGGICCGVIILYAMLVKTIIQA